MSTTIQSLYEDVIYLIVSKCSSSIDIWNLLVVLKYDQEKMIDLPAFWSHIRLTSSEKKSLLFLFIKQIASKCIDLRIDNYHWMTVVDLRRLLSTFRLVVRFHSGNVSLSKSLILNDLKQFFPFLKSLHLLISLNEDIFHEIFDTFQQLDTISLVLQNSKGGCLTNINAQIYFRSICEHLSNINWTYRTISIEENGYDIQNRFITTDSSGKTSLGSINLSLTSNLKHFILSFRSMFDMNLILKCKDSNRNQLQLQTLVLPCLPSIESMNIINLNELILLDLDSIPNLNRLEDYLLHCSSLRNLSIQLNDWQRARFVCQNHSSQQINSIFSNCFDDLISSDDDDDDDDENKTKELPTILEFLDDNQKVLFHFSLKESWLNKLTHLNLTGIHCHSIDIQTIFHSTNHLQTLSLSPCLLFYIHQFQCTCQTLSLPYQMHSINKNLYSLNLVSHLSNLKEPCSIFLEQYHYHCIRHSSIHQNLSNQEHFFQYEQLFRRAIRTLFQQYDFLHLSIRIPNYDLQIDDIIIQKTNHLESLIVDMKFSFTFHTNLALIYSQNLFHSLRRLILISDNHFELTPILIDRFQTLEILEILTRTSHLTRSTIHYLETTLKPTKYPNLQVFRFWIGSVDAKHSLKHLHKTIRLTFQTCRPSFQFDISIFNSTSSSCLLYNHSHEIHRKFHSNKSSHQLSISYPKYLNFKLSYNELNFDM